MQFASPDRERPTEPSPENEPENSPGIGSFKIPPLPETTEKLKQLLGTISSEEREELLALAQSLSEAVSEQRFWHNEARELRDERDTLRASFGFRERYLGGLFGGDRDLVRRAFQAERQFVNEAGRAMEFLKLEDEARKSFKAGCNRVLRRQFSQQEIDEDLRAALLEMLQAV